MEIEPNKSQSKSASQNDSLFYFLIMKFLQQEQIDATLLQSLLSNLERQNLFSYLVDLDGSQRPASYKELEIQFEARGVHVNELLKQF